MDKLTKMPMDLQFFAENENLDTPDLNEVSSQAGDQKNEPDLLPLNEVDRRISKAVESALEKQKAKFEKEKQEEIERVQRKTEEYSKLSEREKLEKELEEREERLKQQEREIRLAKLTNDVEIDLKEKNLPVSLAEVLINTEDIDKIKSIVNDIKATFDDAVNESVKERIRQDTPREGNSMSHSKREKASIADFARKNRIVEN